MAHIIYHLTPSLSNSYQPQTLSAVEVGSGDAAVHNVRLKRNTKEESGPVTAAPTPPATLSWDEFFQILDSISNTTTRVPLAGLKEPTGMPNIT